MPKPLRATVLAILAGLAPSLGLGADFDGSKPLLCATIDAHFCNIGEVCFRTLPEILGAPAFVHINFAKKTIVGSQRSTAIRYMEAGENQLLMQGTELGYSWSIALDTKSGGMSATLVNREDVFVLFGTCTPS
ncbi:hypothetical protein A6V36_19655 [Paraburkholderia ginsengiterrae]|uniref:Uncharacterized protein n=1 Tax=Paraburkholderia ginsengiterrae TaxID=1462993 RepID=A0ABX2V410_9BURK|nr:hypothetical protein [Paraburkholderia ginsengiterrae]OAJ63060.1 hypothetical protein A6V36_19655 [Paraburkholderia ginsengiterrae]